jgi:hypothetical protein
MSPFMGGSAPAMADQVSAGYTLITPVHLKRLTDSELDHLQFEFERIMRDTRATQPPAEDLAAIQARNRKLMRISGALQQLSATRAKRRRAL